MRKPGKEKGTYFLRACYVPAPALGISSNTSNSSKWLPKVTTLELTVEVLEIELARVETAHLLKLATHSSYPLCSF